MLKTKLMTRLVITGLKDQLEPAIKELYLHHAFHIREYVEGKDPEYEGFLLGRPLPGAGAVSEELVRLRGVMSALELKPEEQKVPKRQKEGEIHERMSRDLHPAEAGVEELVRRRREVLEPREHQLGEEIAALTPFAGVPLDLEMYRGFASLVVFTGRISHDVALSVPHEKFFAPGAEGNFIVVFARPEDRADVEAALQGARFQAVAIPEGSGSPGERLAEDKEELTRVQKELGEIQERLGQIRREQGEFLLACEEILSAEAEQYEAPLRFATSQGAFVAEGWIPAGKVQDLTAAVQKATGGKVYVTEIELGHDEKEIPVEYQNPKFAQPTEVITDLHSRPRYSEIDPTLTVAIIFPLFFGIILGDIGYGALLLAVALALPRIIASEEMARMATVLRNCSISAIIFGILFSEFFGFEMPWPPLLPSRHLLIGGGGTEHRRAPRLCGLDRHRPAHPREGPLRSQQVP
jgi:V/A-type H+-transporting ATPase subunit I